MSRRLRPSNYSNYRRFAQWIKGHDDKLILLNIIGYANQWGQVKSKKPNNKKTNSKPNGGNNRQDVSRVYSNLHHL
jgi:hypothetical protein